MKRQRLRIVKWMAPLKMGSTAWNLRGAIRTRLKPVILARRTVLSLDLSRANICYIRRRVMHTYNPDLQFALRTCRLLLTVYNYMSRSSPNPALHFTTCGVVNPAELAKYLGICIWDPFLGS